MMLTAISHYICSVWPVFIVWNFFHFHSCFTHSLTLICVCVQLLLRRWKFSIILTRKLSQLQSLRIPKSREKMWLCVVYLLSIWLNCYDMVHGMRAFAFGNWCCWYCYAAVGVGVSCLPLILRMPFAGIIRFYLKCLASCSLFSILITYFYLKICCVVFASLRDAETHLKLWICVFVCLYYIAFSSPRWLGPIVWYFRQNFTYSSSSSLYLSLSVHFMILLPLFFVCSIKWSRINSMCCFFRFYFFFIRVFNVVNQHYMRIKWEIS